MTAAMRMDTSQFDRAFVELMGQHNTQPSRVAVYAWEKALLGRYSLPVVLEAMDQHIDWYRGKAPHAGDVLTICELLEQYGATATRRAARRWTQGVLPGDPAANSVSLTPARMRHAVEAEFKQVGNPDKPPAALLAAAENRDDTPVDPKYLAEVERLVAEGMPRERAIAKAALNLLGVHDKPMPAARQRHGRLTAEEIEAALGGEEPAGPPEG